MKELELIQGGRPDVLPTREPQTNGEWFQLIIDQLHRSDENHRRILEEIRLQGLQISDAEALIDKHFPSLPLMVADHDARIKILEKMYWRVSGVFIAVTAFIGILEWWFGRGGHP